MALPLRQNIDDQCILGTLYAPATHADPDVQYEIGTSCEPGSNSRLIKKGFIFTAYVGIEGYPIRVETASESYGWLKYVMCMPCTYNHKKILRVLVYVDPRKSANQICKVLGLCRPEVQEIHSTPEVTRTVFISFGSANEQNMIMEVGELPENKKRRTPPTGDTRSPSKMAKVEPSTIATAALSSHLVPPTPIPITSSTPLPLPHTKTIPKQYSSRRVLRTFKKLKLRSRHMDRLRECDGNLYTDFVHYLSTNNDVTSKSDDSS